MIKDSNGLSLRIAKGDEEAFRQFFDMYYGKSFGWALYYLHNRELAEEAAADVFVNIWNKRQVMADVRNIQSYLYIAVKNQALYYMRGSSYRALEPVEAHHALMCDHDDPENIFVDRECGELISQAVDSLPGKCREVFTLVNTDRMKQKETARRLNISVKTVEAHVAAAYKRIATRVNNQYRVAAKCN